MNTSKIGSFKIYVDNEFLMTVRCSYSDVLYLTWPIHYNNPMANIEIVQDTE